MALRRWKPFLAAFDQIDAAIESAVGGVGPEAIIPRDEFKRARNQIVEALCGAADDAAAEAICLVLDDAMAESLVTLQAAAAHAGTPMELLASGELVADVGALARGHGSGRVRGLARDVVLGWRAAVEDVLGTATAAMHALDRVSPPTTTMPRHGEKALPGPPDAATTRMTKKQRAVPVKQQPCPGTTPRRLPLVASSVRVDTTKISEPSPKKPPLPVHVTTSIKVQASAKAPAPQQPKKTSPGSSARSTVSVVDRVSTLRVAQDMKKMEATKRKLHVRYQEFEDAKRRRTIQVVTAPEMLLQKGRRTTHPAVKAPASSAAESRRFDVSSSLRRV